MDRAKRIREVALGLRRREMIKVEAGARLKASLVKAGRQVRTTNARYAWDYLYRGERFNKVTPDEDSTYVDGISAFVDGRNEIKVKKAWNEWSKVAKGLCSDFKASPKKDFATGTWYDEQSNCTWKVEIAKGEYGISLRIRNITKSSTSDLYYEPLDNS
jgi:hypothetical protein